MNEYRIRDTGAVIPEDQLRSMFDTKSLPAVIDKATADMLGVDAVLAAPAPVVGDFQSAVRNGVVQDELGNWVYAWQVQDWSQDEIDAYKTSGKADRWEAIKAERDRRKFNGVLVNDKWIHTDTYSRTQWMGMVMLGQSLPQISWTTMDGSTVTTTPALAQAVFQGVLTLDTTTFAVAQAHKAAMEASANPATYDFSANWLPTFGG